MRPAGSPLRGSVALALFAALLALTTSASAQCAWVLWGETTYQSWRATPSGDFPPESRIWTVIQADRSKAGCDAALDGKVEDVGKAPAENEKVKKSGNMVFITSYAAENIVASRSHRFICLPDTIDPRGKKGE